MEKGNVNIKLFLAIALLLVVGALVAIVFLYPEVLTGSTKGTEEPSGQSSTVPGLNIVDTTNTTTNTTQDNTTTTPVADLESSSFTTKFLKLEDSGKNMIYSPLSIQYALHLLKTGAAGDTRTQIENVLGNHKLTTYKNIDKVLSLANAVFIRENYKNNILNTYKTAVMDKYDSEILYDGFENADNVNKWINEKTMNIIPKLLEDNQVQDPNLQMILVNALAIDMEWKIPFESDNTMKQEFNLNAGTKMDVASLVNTKKDDAISYYKDDNVTALAMDLKEYDGNQFQFIAIMPDKDLSQYARSFEYTDLEKIVNNLKSSKNEKDGVEYHIPRFEYEYDLKLKSDLMQMGITDAFNQMTADFSGMTGGRDLHVDDAIHKAKIELTYKGIKAAAVTAFLMKDNAIAFETEIPHPVVINIDKPFLYVIRDKVSGEVWFVGETYEPMKWEDYQKEQEDAEKEMMKKYENN